MKNILAFIQQKLDQRIADSALRTLKNENNLVDFSSNDYLGFSRSARLKQELETELKSFPNYKLGSTGSRLLTGNQQYTTELEKRIANFHGTESALIFNSGYSANVGLLSSLPQRGDTIIADELIHASIIDGIRLSYSNKFIFKHNDLRSLEDKLQHASGQIFIVVESVYSMDGDEAPLVEIADLALKYNAALIVDEAHAIGVFGRNGCGIVADLNLQDKVFATTITFGKALGVHGAAVIGTKTLIDYLTNFARSFIYTTALPFHNNVAVSIAYKNLLTEDYQEELRSRILYFKYNIKVANLIESRSAVQSLIIGGNEKTRHIACQIQEKGFDVRPILSPTVPSGAERLRICIHNHNSFEEIKDLTDLLNSLSNA